MNTAQDIVRKICEWMTDPHNSEKREDLVLSAHNLNCEDSINTIMNRFEAVDRARHDLKEQGNVKYGERK